MTEDQHEAPQRFARPGQSPLFHAEQAARYSRQELIATYEEQYECRLVVMIDVIYPYSITLFEELIFDADPEVPLHVMLHTPGGDGETAIRLARAAQSRCSKLAVVVPDQAKSAGTLFCLGAHELLMGSTSDLGPVDPQIMLPNGRLEPAKNIIAAVAAAETAVQHSPESFPIHASLLGSVDALQVQYARSAMERSTEQMREALASNPDRGPDEVEGLLSKLQKELITTTTSHSAIFGTADAQRAGLPVIALDPTGDQWQHLWRLWAKYFAEQQRVYEGIRSSKLLGPRSEAGF